MTVLTTDEGPVRIVTINRPWARNAVDPETALALRSAFDAAMADATIGVVVLTGADETFCAGADLKAVAAGESFPGLVDGLGPMGPSRALWPKPVIAAVEGHAVAGGLELALLADLRVASETAVFGVYCRRWGVPLIDGGTVLLPRVIGQGRALDMILTGRPVAAAEALLFGLANRVVAAGEALATAVALAKDIAAFPTVTMLNDRASAWEQWALPLAAAFDNEATRGRASLEAQAQSGAARFAAGAGRGGKFGD
ncbi:MAG: crotonase/enoyl-CoA hydratase family protein [Caulobacterales bacterium]|jgi:enoyl-CoA hydratase